MLTQVARSDVSSGRDQAALDRLGLVEQTARENLAEARVLVAAHAPLGLTTGGIAVAVERLADRLQAETGIDVGGVSSGCQVEEGYRVDAGRDVVLLRACQEALANIRKHAGAGHASVRLDLVEGSARLTVSDDGVGLPAGFTPGIGLESMEARVTARGGSLRVGPRR
jgi:signal transduction histidine kinase